jgi:NAD(P)H-hydrate epimerase
VLGLAVKADLTVSFAFAKLGHIIYPGAAHTGRLIVVDIGIPRALMEEAVGYEFLSEKSVAPLIKRREREAHKGTFGHCLILAGSTGKTGAAALAANSCVRSGAGLVTLAVPEKLNPVLELKTTEAMTLPLPDDSHGHLSKLAFKTIEKQLPGKNAVAVGPGIGMHADTVNLVQTLTESVKQPMVIDADGLNAVAEDLSVLQRKASSCLVITPHPGEMARLHGSPLPDIAAIRISIAQDFARDHDVYIVLKGARTIIAAPDGMVAINGSGNPGMASGGTGDVLTGVITSLLGQGYPPWHACRIGVFIHGLAGDMVAIEKGEIGITASDITEMLPYAFNRLLSTTYHDDSPIFIQ